MISKGNIVNVDHFYNETNPGTKGEVVKVFIDEHGNQWATLALIIGYDGDFKFEKSFPVNVLTILKCYVLTISKRFPVKHLEAGNKTHFASKIILGEKIHTIRANYELWLKRVEQINDNKAYLSIREWTGKPYASKQREITKIFKMGIEQITMLLKKEDVSWSVEKQNPPYHLFEVASKDGLQYGDFLRWFFPGFKPGKFEGAILHFTDFRYTDPNKKVKSK